MNSCFNAQGEVFLQRLSGVLAIVARSLYEHRRLAAREAKSLRSSGPDLETKLKKPLPKLLFYGDVGPTSTFAGPLQLHRILSPYPPERLLLVYPGAATRQDIPGARYMEPAAPWWLPLWHRRGGKHLLLLMSALGWVVWRFDPKAPRWLSKAACEFGAEAILTVGMAGAWMASAQVARRRGIPLHVVVHDHRHYCAVFPNFAQAFVERWFGSVYRSAASRLLTSRPMERKYFEMFGAHGIVLNPTRGPDTPHFDSPPRRLEEEGGLTRVVYAGSVWGDRLLRILTELGDQLRHRGMRLIAYFSNNVERSARVSESIEVRPAVPSAEVVETLREHADILLHCSSFEASSRDVVATLFPSKLVDYSATALPVFVFAPEYSSAADLCREYPDAFAFTSSPEPAQIADRLFELAQNPTRAIALGRANSRVGRRLFDPASGYSKLTSALVAGADPKRGEGDWDSPA